MNYSDVVSADQRLVILQALEQDAGYSHNEHVLRSMLSATGHHVSHDRLRSHLAWLEEQGLIRIERVGDLQVACLTARGEDAARGHAIIPGVARPRLS